MRTGDLLEIIDIQRESISDLKNENQRMIHIIRESIKNERTDMGRNALKQLADNLGVDYD